ncbi:acetoacetate decarboxylase family protein [Martelella mediterranea]|uniref:acetoacetate decarboxylase family protein n=1 Tax=Martelella mediterranea TaxID=293089 RepID=UPI001E3A12F5|nr:acetoacetate decarboxylase family protein [Martelella mediterranea]MCD1636518.1 acetoacetate decarboxylase family protein [Martelella mediterranea]
MKNRTTGSFRSLEVNEGDVLPSHRQTYPAIPTFYRGIETQFVEMTVDPEVAAAHVPKPLVADPSGAAIGIALKIPMSSYGPFNEAGIHLKCTLDGEPVWYNSHLFLNNVTAICAGRERWGVAKEFAEISFSDHENVRVCEVVKEGATLMRLSTTWDALATPGELPDITPNMNLKIIPRADGPGAAIKQLVEYCSEEVGESTQMSGLGHVEFRSTAKTDLAPLNPVALGRGFYHRGDLAELHGKIRLDYLANG